MTTTITRWGNSSGIRIPKPVLDSLYLKNNDKVELSVVENAIIVKKIIHTKTIEERFEAFYGTDFETALENNPYNFPEFQWGKPMGDEAW